MASEPSAEDMERFRACSPIATADRVTAPMCFLLGGKDRRVVMADAKLYASVLRARGQQAPETRMVLFPEDTHALDRPQAEFEGWLTHAWWLKEHMGAP